MPNKSDGQPSRRAHRDLRIRTDREKPAPEQLPGKVTDIRAGERRRSPKKRWARVLIRLGIVAAALAVALTVMAHWDTLSPTAMWSNIQDVWNGKNTGDGFPVSIEGGMVADMAGVGNRLAVLIDTSLLFLNSKGGEADRRAHAFVHPAMRVAGTYLLVADIGSRRLRLDTPKGTLWEKEESGGVVALAVTASGEVAAAMESSRSYRSEVAVFNKAGTEIYRWYSTEWLVTGVALRGDGRQMAVTGIAAEEGGSMKTALLVFDLTKEEPLATFTGTELMLMAVGYYKNGALAAVGDIACWSISTDLKTRTETAYSDVSLLGCVIGEAGTALVVQHYGSDSGGEARLLDTAGTQTAGAAFTGRFQDCVAAGTGFWLLSERELMRLEPGKSEAVTARTAVAADSLRVAVYTNHAVVLGLTEIRFIKGI